MAQGSNGEAFVVSTGWVRLTLLTTVFIFSAVLFIFLSAVFAAIEVDSAIGRFVLVLVALGVFLLAIYMLLLLLTMVNRVEVRSDRVLLRMARTRGVLPLPRLIRADIPYSDVRSVESREEIYSTFGLTTMLRAYSLVTRDGTRLPLGVMAENAGFQMPFDRAAALIAERAHTGIVVRGAVRVGGILHSMISDVPPWSAEPLSANELAAAQRRATITLQVIGLLVMSVALLRACSQH